MSNIKLVDDSIVKLCSCFYRCNIDFDLNFIAFSDSKYDGLAWFSLRDLTTQKQLIKKVLCKLSRGAFKSVFYDSNKKNEQVQKYILDALNLFLNTNFSKEDMQEIYTFFGNYTNLELLDKFIDSNYDMNLLKKERK